MIVWRLLKYISAPSSKTVGDRGKVFEVTCQVPRDLLFGDIAPAQWLTTRHVEARVHCVPDRPTFLRSHNSNTVGKPLGRTGSMFGDDAEGVGDPGKVFVSVHYWRALIK